MVDLFYVNLHFLCLSLKKSKKGSRANEKVSYNIDDYDSTAQ